MGLDMWAMKIAKPEDPSPVNKLVEVDFSPSEYYSEDQISELCYWRKHPNLHGWMEQLYYKKGGKSSSFNGCNLVLTLEDIEDLEKDVMYDKLPHTAGFFFGESDPDDKEKDLEFIKLAKKELESGNVIYYTSWW